MTENEIDGWYQGLNGHEFEQTSGDGQGQGSLACCSQWGHKESDTTEQQLNNNNKTMSGSSWQYPFNKGGKEAKGKNRQVVSSCQLHLPSRQEASDREVKHQGELWKVEK